MATEEEKYKIPLFDGTNYDNWKFRLEILLDELDLLEYTVENYKNMVTIVGNESTDELAKKEKELSVHRKKDKKCKSHIIQRISDNYLEIVKDQETAFNIWDTLKQNYQRKGIANQLYLRKTLLTMKYDTSSGSLGTHFLNFDKLIRELRSTGAKLEETDVVCHLLLTMPQEYEVVVTAIETLSTEKLTLGFVKNRLLDEEKKREAGNSLSQSDLNQSFPSVSSKYKDSAYFRKRPTCDFCGKFGHRKSQCRKLNKYDSQNTRKAHVVEAESDEFTLVSHLEDQVNISSCDKKVITWYVDSGATEHMISSDQRHFLTDIKKLDTSVQIKVAKCGQQLEAVEVGDMHVIAKVWDKENKLKISDVLIVPDLQYNLLSVQKLDTLEIKIWQWKS